MIKTILVSNRLPVSIQKKDGNFISTLSSGGLATGLSSVYTTEGTLWLGWPGLQLHSKEDKDKVTEMLNAEKMHPVFLSKQDINKYYSGYSNETVWPLFHYFPRLARFRDDTWDYYKKVNKHFCDELLSKITDDNVTIWVHDYHLFLLPGMLREKMPNATIGFFQHIPFPSYEIFRLLPERAEILEGLMGADMVGFHTYDDMRHFLSSVHRILGYSHAGGCIEHKYRKIKVDAFPMGIDYDKFAELSKAKGTLKKEAYFRKNTGDRKLLLSVDRLDLSKGIPEKLQAFELFLDENPDWREKCSLIMVVVPSRTQVEEYQLLESKIEQEVGRINGKYSRIAWTPVHFLFRGLTPETLSALYRTCEVALITPLRDGMNLVAKEFVASKTDKPGVLILSEMAGASKELSEAIVVNPFNMREVAMSIHKALNMSEDSQWNRIYRMQDKLKRNNVHKWAELYLKKLKDTKATDSSSALTDFKPIENIKKAYRKAKKRVICLDYDGTLVPFFSHPSEAKPNEELIEILKNLCANPLNLVVVISGRDRKSLGTWMEGNNIPVDMIAEHGLWIKEYGKEWIQSVETDNQWKEGLRHIFEEHVDRTPGSMLEEKEHSLVWHYRNTDQDFGQIRAGELNSNLEYFVTNRKLSIMQGNKVIELKPSDINKGYALLMWLSRHPNDFIAAFGDDVTDEDMFKALSNEAYTVKVGKNFRFTAAQYHLKSYKEVRKLLQEFAVE